MDELTRRRLLVSGAAVAGGSLLAGCDQLSRSPSFMRVLGAAEKATQTSQRLILKPQPLAREFQPGDISKVFKANGTVQPDTDAYKLMEDTAFADWRLRVDGLVVQPLSLSLDELKLLPQRTQITRHDCVEGWSAIGQWTGVPLSLILRAAGAKPGARYAVFHCADNLGRSQDDSGLYYESLDLFDCLHPQTILAHTMNGEPLDVAHGAPLRLRVERQLGYKNAKYLMRIELVDHYSRFGGGKGGFWEDRGYEWYAGI